jgi:hypothetical protein
MAALAAIHLDPELCRIRTSALYRSPSWTLLKEISMQPRPDDFDSTMREALAGKTAAEIQAMEDECSDVVASHLATIAYAENAKLIKSETPETQAMRDAVAFLNTCTIQQLDDHVSGEQMDLLMDKLLDIQLIDAK